MTNRLASCSFGKLTASTQADPDFPQPRVSVYEVRKHHWVHLPDGMEHFD